MKKIIIATLLLLAPMFFVHAECDMNKYETYKSYADHITYDNEYSMSSGSFSITLYNVIKGLTVQYDGKTYKGDGNDSLTIRGVPEGTSVNIYVYGDDGCGMQARIITIMEPYYNSFYGSDLCKDYVEVLNVCSSKFTAAKTTQATVEQSIMNYKNEIIQEITHVEEPEVEEPKVNHFKNIIAFAKKHWLKGVIGLLSYAIAYTIFENKFRKIKHGI